ncbi:MAG: cytochrome d ubiquinol oxidase subunit II [Victivallaceae bacterium]
MTVSNPAAVIWYAVLFISIAAYLLGDGFDLGTGLLYSFIKKEENKRLTLRAISPFWDGNEVWLIIIFGGLLAGFPNVYGLILSIFYTPIWELVLGLIFRGIAIEVRNHSARFAWRLIWDLLFSFSSLLITFILGTLLGNLMAGISLNISSTHTFFRAYPSLIGLLSVFVCALQGGTYLCMKAEHLYNSLRQPIRISLVCFGSLYIISFFSAFIYLPEIFLNFFNFPLLFVFPLLNIILYVMLVRSFFKNAYGKAFLYSCLNICCLTVTVGCLIFPYLLRFTDGMESLTLFNSAVDAKTLNVLLIMLAIGLPFVIGYNIFIYRLFRNKITDSEHY